MSNDPEKPPLRKRVSDTLDRLRDTFLDELDDPIGSDSAAEVSTVGDLLVMYLDYIDDTITNVKNEGKLDDEI